MGRGKSKNLKSSNEDYMSDNVDDTLDVVADKTKTEKKNRKNKKKKDKIETTQHDSVMESTTDMDISHTDMDSLKHLQNERKKKKHKHILSDDVDEDGEKIMKDSKKDRKKSRKAEENSTAMNEMETKLLQEKDISTHGDSNCKKAKKTKRKLSLVVSENEEMNELKSKKKKKKKNLNNINESMENADSVSNKSGDNSDIQAKNKHKSKKKKKPSKKSCETTLDKCEKKGDEIVNESDYVEKNTIKKKKKSKKPEKEAIEINKTENTSEASETKPHLGQWETASFEDAKKQEKFHRLLGGFKNKNSQSKFNVSGFNRPISNFALDKKGQDKLNSDLQAQYDNAMSLKLGFSKGIGFGYEQSKGAGKKFYIDTSKSSSIKFDD